MTKRVCEPLCVVLVVMGSQVSSMAQPEIPDAKRPVSTLSIPARLTLCGEEIPLHREDVRERLEREFYTNLDREGQLVLYLKRAGRVFPVVERILRELGMPQDLKHVPVAESGLSFRAASPAQAVGYWQFVEGTAKRYGLVVNPYVDERRDLEKSTRAACAYLRDLYREFGSWAMALGAYNWGEARMRHAVKEQGTSYYYDLYLPDETDRFVFRIACLKLILENPQRHDIYVSQDALYSSGPTDTVTVNAREWLRVATLAKAAGVPPRTFRFLNPWMTSSSLPPGTYRFCVPSASSPSFAAALRVSSPSPSGSARAESVAVHVVKPGESLARIAQRYGVTVHELIRWNNLAGDGTIHPGQRLVVANPVEAEEPAAQP